MAKKRKKRKINIMEKSLEQKINKNIDYWKSQGLSDKEIDKKLLYFKFNK